MHGGETLIQTHLSLHRFSFHEMQVFTSLYGCGSATADKWYNKGIRTIDDSIDNGRLYHTKHHFFDSVTPCITLLHLGKQITILLL